MSSAQRILRVGLLEDNPIQAEQLKDWIVLGGNQCVLFSSASEFQRGYRKSSFDVLLLDWNLPDGTGLDVLKWLRQTVVTDTPVLFVTSRQQETDIVEALNAGADDYLIKPVRRLEIQARIRALTRRSQPVSLLLAFWPYSFDTQKRQLVLYGELLKLTEKEYDMALFLFKNKGRVVSRQHLLTAVWGTAAELNTRTVDTHASRLRKKLRLKNSARWRLSSVYQHGYRLENHGSKSVTEISEENKAMG